MCCEHLNNCPLFGPDTGLSHRGRRVFREIYCTGDKMHCARYMVRTAVGESSLPDDLYPFELSRAESLIRSAAGPKIRY